MRCARRYCNALCRDTPCRANRSNRARGGISPSTKARWQLKLRLCRWLARLFTEIWFKRGEMGVLKSIKNKRGFLIEFAYLMPVLILFVALVIEFTQIRMIKNELQAMVDAASLAGVMRAHVMTDVTYENRYDDNGNLIGVYPVAQNYRLINDDLEAFDIAVNTMLENIEKHPGWGTDGTTRITVDLSRAYGEPISSGLSDAVTGNGVPDDRGDYSDLDEYYFTAEARVKTVFVVPALKLFNALTGTPVPVNDLNEIVLKAESTSRTKARVE